MKKVNKKLISSIMLGLLLYAPVTNVYAAELSNGSIKGDSDSYGSYRTEGNSGEFTYDFSGDSQLNITNSTNDKQGIFIMSNNKDTVNKITINDKLDISITNVTGSLNGILISGGANDKTIDRRYGGDIRIESIGDQTDAAGAFLTGANISAGSGNTILLGDTNITLMAVDAEKGMNLNGLYVDNGSDNSITMGNGSIKLEGDVESVSSHYNQGIGMMALKAGNSITTGDVSIDIKITNDQNTIENVNSGIDVENGAEITTGNGAITVHGIGGNAVYTNGVFAYNEGAVTKTGGNITATAEGEGILAARGIFSRGGTVDIGISDVTAKAIGGSTDGDNWIEAIGMVGWGSGEINYAGGTITATADNDGAYVAAIHAQDSTDININQDTTNKVVINGDVNNYGSGSIFLNLNTADSALNGGVYDENGTFTLANNAKWNVLGDSTVNNFNIDKGIINMSTEDDVYIKNYGSMQNVVGCPNVVNS